MPRDRARVRQARLAAAVLGLTMVLWMGAQWLGGRLGWETRYVFLFDLMAIAAFVWTMAVTWRLWRERQ
ncbi:MAG TPA: DUF5337 domain-containing protein [Paracoccaceae bacterium]|nr:DUF5337 domain-containing protein [Paracoccaceae bacterium]HMO71314.1 DUF5337 domain-containing protein [Paracoccaceae bacterium]